MADFSVDALGRLSPYDPEEPPELLVSFDVSVPDLVPDPPSLLAAAQAWVADFDMAASERVTFYSADEAPAPPLVAEPKRTRPVLHLSRPKQPTLPADGGSLPADLLGRSSIVHVHGESGPFHERPCLCRSGCL